MQMFSLDQLGDEIAELSAHLDAATARLLDLIREFDAREGWNNGFISCAAWPSWRVGLAPGAAREHVRVARALGTLPRLAQALARGELSYAKIRALTRVATPDTEERLLAVGREGTAEHVERIVRGWRRVDRQAEAREAALQHAGRALHVYPDADGTVMVRGRLTPEAGALLVQALAAARETLYQRARDREPDADPPTMVQQQADALALLAETALHHGIDPGAPGERYQVVVHVDAEVLADADQPGQSVLENGARVPAGTSQRLACDASRVVMRHGRDGRVVEVDARTRTIPPALRRALHPSRPRLPLPGLRSSRWPGPSYPSLGARWPHHIVESGPALSPAPPRRARGRLPGRSTVGRRASVPPPGRAGPARGPASFGGARRRRAGLAGAARGGGVGPAHGDREARLAWRAAGRGLGDRRLAPAGHRAGADLMSAHIPRVRACAATRRLYWLSTTGVGLESIRACLSARRILGRNSSIRRSMLGDGPRTWIRPGGARGPASRHALCRR